ncbi:thioredoxin family protein [Pedobacter gandavensis]|uniref:thioredoxin family protein n=1 Tax=Pedobacter gandavensis TaxID=2679963 RepID=UPI00292F3ED0|nr:thioredoxin fold domain-containing protein [Pedobacter gandavensis]
MRKLLVVIISMITGTSYSQGINFENLPGWKEVLMKAKNENKAIFVDAFTTWCGPCKQMDKEVFPKSEVGDFFNANFISFKLQMDQTSKDDAFTKLRYADAKMFEQTYKITSYPCYLFFDSEGKLIHKAGGGGLKPAAFIEIGKEALDPGKQLLSYKRKYLEGYRETEFLKTYVYKLAAAGDPQLGTVADEYLLLQKDQFSLESVQMRMFMTTGSDSKYFRVLQKNQDKLAAVLGVEKAGRYLKKVIDAELMSRALKVGVGPDQKKVYQVDEPGLLAYLGQFYAADTAAFLAEFHAVTVWKLLDQQKAYQLAKRLVAHHRKQLNPIQTAQITLIIAGKGTNQDDNKLALSLLALQADHKDFQVQQTLCKLYAYNGLQEKALFHAGLALSEVRKTRPNYPNISPEEFLTRTLSASPTPQIISN